MTLFSVHRAGDRVRLVPDRFSLPALLFGPLALAVAGAWLGALLLVAAWMLALRFGLVVLYWGLPALAGLFASDWRRFELGLGGWRADGVVAGLGADHAALRLADQDATGVRRVRDA